MFPDGWWIFPLLTAIVVIGGGVLLAEHVVMFLIHHWVWIWPHLKHAVHWWLFGN